MVTGFSPQVRELVRQRATADLDDRYVVCEVMARCPGRVVALWDLHHRRPRASGGSRRPETNLAGNALGACRDCHAFIEANRETAFANGWLVRQNQTPAEIPVLYRHKWMVLSDDGSVTPASCVCGEVGSGGRFVPERCICVEGDA